MLLLLSTSKRRFIIETCIGTTSSPSCSGFCCSSSGLVSSASLVSVWRVAAAVVMGPRPRDVLGLVLLVVLLLFS